MSPDDTKPQLPKKSAAPEEDAQELLAGIVPDPVELKPIPAEKKPDKPQDDDAGGTGKKRWKKVHAPDRRAKQIPAELPLADEPSIGDLPEFPVLRPEAPPEGEEAELDPAELAEALANPDEQPPEEVTADGEAPSSPGDTQEGTESEGVATPDAQPAAAPNASQGPGTALPRLNLDPSDRKWLLILLGGLFVVGIGFYFLLRPGLPVDSVYNAQITPNLPIKGERLTIRELTIDWKDNDSGSLAGGINAKTLLPRISMRFEPGSTGSARLFFRDERELLVGDTVDLELANGGLDRVVTCTVGLRSRLEYDALRSRDLERWTIEIHEGPRPGAPLSEFKLLCRLAVPWNLDKKSSP
ncbi:MAG: hypothetical protein ACKO2G_07095 [Verrucomicrobiales bacterium]